MPFIGNTPQTQSFAPAIDYFSGNGVTVTFTLSRPVVSVAQLTVAVDNVIQNPSSAFTVSGNSITFTSAPLSGTNNIWVEYTSLITTYAAISQDPSVIGDITATGGFLAEGDFGNSYIDGTVVDYVTGNARITTGPIDNMTFYHGGTSGRSEMMELYYAGGAKIFGTTALTIPVGTTAQRPGTPANGMIRYNTTLNQFEVYQNGNWTQYSYTYSVEYLAVAGGGGGGGYRAGGGGGGGFLTGSLQVSSNTSYSVTVGAGGTGGVGGNTTGTRGSSGSNSVFASITAVGGGGGGAPVGGQEPLSGGSGGGAAGGGTGASGTSGQGNAGGNGVFAAPNYGAGGGGGASAAGTNGISTTGGAGGNGTASSISGSSVTYAGGGAGGAIFSAPTVSGGAGGGGNSPSNSNGGNGTVNTGGGGGGANSLNDTTTYNGGAGGSGIVIIRYLGAQRGTGGTVTSSGGYTIHTFTTSGTFTA